MTAPIEDEQLGLGSRQGDSSLESGQPGRSDRDSKFPWAQALFSQSTLQDRLDSLKTLKVCPQNHQSFWRFTNFGAL